MGPHSESINPKPQGAMVAALEAELEGPGGTAAKRLATLAREVASRPPLAAALQREAWWSSSVVDGKPEPLSPRP